MVLHILEQDKAVIWNAAIFEVRLNLLSDGSSSWPRQCREGI